MSSNRAILRVAIIGSGLGGLAAALFLRRAGIRAIVYEQATELREVGAGIVVAPNMVRPLASLGLIDQLEAFSVRLEAAWEFRRWQDGEILFSQPMGEACEQLYGAHCYVAHRADLMSMFVQAFGDSELRLDHRCVGIEQTDNDVQIQFESADGRQTVETADVVIGADGIHSVVRPFVLTEADARFSGLCAFRCLVRANDAPEMAQRPVQTLWLGPGRHFVHYPISGGDLINIVAIVPAGDWRSESWTAKGQIPDLIREFSGWDNRLQEMITSATDTRRWALYDRMPIEKWTDHRVGLLGDSAHAMLPFFAQGAAQAIEDAVVLSACLESADPQSVPVALQRYERIRRPRASEVQLMSRGREIRNHLPDGPEQQERDAQLVNGDPLQQSAWLYGHDLSQDIAAGWSQ